MNPVSVCGGGTVTPGSTRYVISTPANELRGRLSPAIPR